MPKTTPEQRSAWVKSMVSCCPAEDRRELGLALLRADQQMPPDEDACWLIYFHDKEMQPEMMAGPGAEEAARARFASLRTAWSIILFKEVARG